MSAHHHDWEPLFLAALAKAPNVSAAARAAKIDRTTAYSARGRNPDFAAKRDEALEAAIDDLVGEAYRRARRGTKRPVFYAGKPCGFVREYSDTLAIFLLKCHRPSVYGSKPAPSDVPGLDQIARELAEAGDAYERRVAEGKEPPWDDEEGR
jgi:hypothetical protein